MNATRSITGTDKAGAPRQDARVNLTEASAAPMSVGQFFEGQQVDWRARTQGHGGSDPIAAVVRKLGSVHVQIEIGQNVRGEWVQSCLWVSPDTLSPRERHVGGIGEQQSPARPASATASAVRQTSKPDAADDVGAHPQPVSTPSSHARRSTMASLNKVTLIGNLGRDPEVRYGTDGGAFCKVSIATTSQWIDKETGEVREETEWHRVVLFNRLAEIAGEYLKKGRSIYVEGRLKTTKWQDKQTGQDRYATEIVADQMQMLGGHGGEQAEQPGSQAPAQRARPGNGAATRQGDAIPKGASAPGNAADPHDDLPF